VVPAATETPETETCIAWNILTILADKIVADTVCVAILLATNCKVSFPLNQLAEFALTVLVVFSHFAEVLETVENEEFQLALLDETVE
jgi:hypothetical protein